MIENTRILIIENEQDYTYVLERWDDGSRTKRTACRTPLEAMVTLTAWVRIYGGASVEWTSDVLERAQQRALADFWPEGFPNV